jgi:hypothetical protein
MYVAEQPYEKTYRRQVVRLYEAITSRGIPTAIESVEFDDCEIYGPAVVAAVDDSVFDTCTFDAPPEVLFIEAQPNRPYVGIIGLKHVRFFACRFHNVGMLGLPGMIPDFTPEPAGE